MGSATWSDRLRRALGGAALALLVAACAPAAPPTTTPQTSAQASAPSAAAAPTDAAAEWEQTVAAAKTEGRLVILGHPTSQIREGLTEGFQRKYPEIKVEYQGLSGAQVSTRVFNERQAGQYLVDLALSGTTTSLGLIEGGAVDPLPAYLQGPETRDTSNWLGGKLDFADESGQYNLVFIYNLNTILAYNPGLVARGEVQSYRDLLNPKWRGKIAMNDPRIAGKAASTAAFLYTTEGLGKEYLVQLFEHGIMFSRDDRQVLDWVVRGQYPLTLAPSESAATDLRSKGVTVEILGAGDIKEGSFLGAGSGTLVVMNRAPHPNAVKVYLDYLLSWEGQHAYSQAAGFPSRRLDVPTDHLPPYMVARPGTQYPDFYKQERLKLMPEVMEFVTSIIRS
jgi:iron(III) transport system substrate-binding protein